MWLSPNRLAAHAGPPTIAAWQAERLDVFWGASGRLQHCWYVPDERGWRAAETLTTVAPLTSPPSVCSWAPQRLDLFWRGPSGDLRHKWYDGDWGPGSDAGAQEDALPVDAPLVAAPAVCSWGPDRLDIFWRDTSNRLHHLWYDHGWGGQQVVRRNPRSHPTPPSPRSALTTCICSGRPPTARSGTSGGTGGMARRRIARGSNPRRPGSGVHGRRRRRCLWN